jgi:hypothetical protein
MKELAASLAREDSKRGEGEEMCFQSRAESLNNKSLINFMQKYFACCDPTHRPDPSHPIRCRPTKSSLSDRNFHSGSILGHSLTVHSCQSSRNLLRHNSFMPNPFWSLSIPLTSNQSALIHPNPSQLIQIHS